MFFAKYLRFWLKKFIISEVEPSAKHLSETDVNTKRDDTIYCALR